MRVRVLRNVAMLLATCVWAVLVPNGATAGPPLVSDDPSTIGRGRVEALLAIRGSGDFRTNVVAAPVVDVTLGLAEGLDFVVVGEPVFVADSLADPSNRWSTSASIEGGFKWRLLAGDHFSASFTPVIGVDVLSAEKLFVRFPVQVEARFGRFAVGVDGGWQVVRHGLDGWNASIYGSWQTTPKLALMAEL